MFFFASATPLPSEFWLLVLYTNPPDDVQSSTANILIIIIISTSSMCVVRTQTKEKKKKKNNRQMVGRGEVYCIWRLFHSLHTIHSETETIYAIFIHAWIALILKLYSTHYCDFNARRCRHRLVAYFRVHLYALFKRIVYLVDVIFCECSP